MSDIRSNPSDVEDSEDANAVREESLNIVRSVPISEAEIFGFAKPKDKSGVILEFGFYNGRDKNLVTIDSRKLITLKMAENLYSNLKNIFEKNDENKKEG